MSSRDLQIEQRSHYELRCMQAVHVAVAVNDHVDVNVHDAACRS